MSVCECVWFRYSLYILTSSVGGNVLQVTRVTNYFFGVTSKVTHYFLNLKQNIGVTFPKSEVSVEVLFKYDDY